MSSNIFEQAARLKIRFHSPRGALTVEHLYDLPLTGAHDNTDLDSIAKGLDRSIREAESTVSFVYDTTSADTKQQQIALEIVKRVIKTKLDESNHIKKELANQERKRFLMHKLAEKENAELDNRSAEELRKELQELTDSSDT